jgi:hypothetical protein
MTKPNPVLCECGCGQSAPIADRNDPQRGYIKGQPRRFVAGHQHGGERNGSWKGASAGYSALHRYLNDHYPKTGICDKCGAAARTEYALIRGREYSRDRSGYRELCPACHRAYDIDSRPRGERNRKAKLTEDAVRDIRRRYAAGEPRRSLALLYGISLPAIHQVVTGKTWRWL